MIFFQQITVLDNTPGKYLFFVFESSGGSLIFFCNSRRRAIFFLQLQIYQFLQTELQILEAPYRYTPIPA